MGKAVIHCHFRARRRRSACIGWRSSTPSHPVASRVGNLSGYLWIILQLCDHVGGAVASWLVRSTPERAVRVRALAGDSVLCSWARHFTLTVPLSTQVHKWVPAICWGNLTKLRGVTCDGLASCPGEVEILLAASCYRNRDKLWQL